MSEPYIGAIKMFAGNFAPQGYAMCNGQLMAISQNTALFSLLGTTFGGDGQSNYALPDLRGRAPIHVGQGPGLGNFVLGEVSGTEAVTLSTNELPAHSHVPRGGAPAGVISPANAYWSTDPGGNTAAYSTEAPNDVMAADAIAFSGGSQAHNNMQPYLCINFIIALQGIYPSRN